MDHAGPAVVFSGTTVAIALLALIILPVPFLRSIGIAGMLIPLVSVVVAVTLLPVVLATIGPRLDWPRRRRGPRGARLDRVGAAGGAPPLGGGDRLVRGAGRRSAPPPSRSSSATRGPNRSRSQGRRAPG